MTSKAYPYDMMYKSLKAKCYKSRDEATFHQEAKEVRRK